MSQESEPTPQIYIHGLRGGGVKTSKIRATVAMPQQGVAGGIFLNWSEEDNDILAAEMEALGTPRIEEYGLHDPPGFGVWIFEGELKAIWSRCGNPLDPPDYDLDIEWTGEWRQPSDEELEAVRGFKPVLTKKVGPE